MHSNNTAENQIKCCEIPNISIHFEMIVTENNRHKRFQTGSTNSALLLHMQRKIAKTAVSALRSCKYSILELIGDTESHGVVRIAA